MATTYREGQVIQHEGPTPPADPAPVESPAAPGEPDVLPAEPVEEPAPEPAQEPTTAPPKRKAKKR